MKARARSGVSFTLAAMNGHVVIGRGGSAAFDHTWKYKPPSVSDDFRIDVSPYKTARRTVLKDTMPTMYDHR